MLNLKTSIFMNTKDYLWSSRLSTESGFCKALVSCGYLTKEQMLRAVQRYRLGLSRDGSVIFWLIDAEQRIRDGKIMYYREDCHRDKNRHPGWFSAMLTRLYAYPYEVPIARCLFGLHLLTPATTTVAVVESEKTAVIMSERIPQYVWMATGGLSALSAEKLRPLSERHVILFPDTDPEGKAYARWKTVAEEASRHSLYPVYVSDLLEQKATAEQKARKIDIADYLFET